jgi:phosphatidylglycerol:prolipoprotein diacylglycerol transferase
MPIHHLHLVAWDVRTWTLVGQAPFLILVAILYWAGRRRGWPWRSSALATGAFVAGLSLGTAFLPSVLGAAAGGIALWLLAQRALGLRRPPIAALALGLAGLIAIGRWGCLLNGCCFGTMTDLPWAVHYDSSSTAYFLHQALGLLAPDATHALGVHPYPLYESAGLLLWLPVGFLLLRRLRSEAALLAFTVAFDLGLRGFIDGKRAMINVWWSVLGQWLGFNIVSSGLDVEPAWSEKES